MGEKFESMLTGGHPNSLGRTIEVVEIVLKNSSRFEELFACYQSQDEIVRLRTSNAMKRVEAENHALLVPYIDKFLNTVSTIQQASAQWTLAQLFLQLENDMNDTQHEKAIKIMKHNLAEHDDWIVLNHTMKTLGAWATRDHELHSWLTPHLERLSQDARKSVAKTAEKYLKELA